MTWRAMHRRKKRRRLNAVQRACVVARCDVIRLVVEEWQRAGWIQ